MHTHQVGYLIGSLAKQSINRKLAKALVQLAPPQLQMREIYSYDYYADFPPVARTFKETIASVDAVLFVTPEYNRSIPGGLKNAIDWASRPYGKNSFARKPSAVIGTSPGDRNRRRPAKPAQRAEFLQFAADERSGSIHPVFAGPDHSRRGSHRWIYRGIPAQLHVRIRLVHCTCASGFATGCLIASHPGEREVASATAEHACQAFASGDRLEEHVGRISGGGFDLRRLFDPFHVDEEKMKRKRRCLARCSFLPERH